MFSSRAAKVKQWKYADVVNKFCQLMMNGSSIDLSEGAVFELGTDIAQEL